ncbi:hypothetical protein RJ639_036797 [Escallonia herrerae]|uniref:Uncharacterized protein n=1 Tax=Escallonia herrerae TaxID=1293975 RepID=A0AA88WWT7_9ASTE|nr:hypothetical protein RJ639_036797 [Escallonia herrerae]
MGRGVSAGGGQSSLGYLFGSGETMSSPQAPKNPGQSSNNEPPQKSAAPSPPVDVSKQIPAGIHDSKTNNYLRADGQNRGNFITFAISPSLWESEIESYCLGHVSITIRAIRNKRKLDRPSTKVHAAPGGGSSLGYLFGDGKK